MRHAADGRVLDVGRRTRTISPGLRRALEHRDGGCRFPGCDNKLCDAHHVEPWADGGATSLANTLLLCRRHHRAVHEEGFKMKLAPDGEARFYRPDGRPLPAVPALPTVAGEPVVALVSRLASHGVDVDAGATIPAWWGGSVDYNWEIEWLRSRDPRCPASVAG
jgi:HNH endonuclease